jgi:hypothetical protein
MCYIPGDTTWGTMKIDGETYKILLEQKFLIKLGIISKNTTLHQSLALKAQLLTMKS